MFSKALLSLMAPSQQPRTCLKTDVPGQHFSSLCQNETILCCDVYKNPLLLMEVASSGSFSCRCMINVSHWLVLLHMVSYIILLSWCSTDSLTISCLLICHNLFKIKYKFIEVEVLARITLFQFLDITATEGRKKQLTWEICFVFLQEKLLNWSRNSEWFLCFAHNAMSHVFVLFFCAYLWWPTLVTLYPKSSNSLLWWITTQNLDVSNESYLTL